MPKGGARVGAGRKPKTVFMPQIHVGGRMDEPGISAIPPEDLPEEQRDFWHRYAGLAIEKGTLTQHSVAGFRLLCELDAERRETKETIREEGRTFQKVTVDGAGQEHTELKAHPMVARYDRLCKQVEGLLARYGLAAFGKPEAPIRRKAAANPFAQVAASK